MNKPRIIKKGFLTALAFWIIVVLVLVRISATLQLTSAIPVLDGIIPGGQTCQLADDSVEVFSTVYTTPSDVLANKYSAGRTGNNLSPNPLFKQYANNQLVGYPDNQSVYPSEKDVISEDGTNFLRAKQKITGDSNHTAWHSEFIPINDNAYYFKFDYRSDVNSEVTVEFLDSEQNYATKWLYELTHNSAWSSVEGHFDNYHGLYSSARVVVSTTDVGSVDIKNPELYLLKDGRLSTAVVSLSFDDGWRSVYDKAKPIFDEYSVKTTQFIVPSLAEEKADDYMNFNQVIELNNSGHEIASHSLAHCDLTSLKPEDLEKDFAKSSQIFNEVGFTNQLGLAYPYGRYNQQTQDNALSHFTYQRTSVQDYNDGYFDPRAIKSMSVEDDTSLEQFKSWVDYAVKHKLWLVLTYHKVGENGQYNTTESDLRSQIEIIRDSGAQILPINQSLGLFSE